LVVQEESVSADMSPAAPGPRRRHRILRARGGGTLRPQSPRRL